MSEKNGGFKRRGVLKKLSGIGAFSLGTIQGVSAKKAPTESEYRDQIRSDPELAEEILSSCEDILSTLQRDNLVQETELNQLFKDRQTLSRSSSLSARAHPGNPSEQTLVLIELEGSNTETVELYVIPEQSRAYGVIADDSAGYDIVQEDGSRHPEPDSACTVVDCKCVKEGIQSGCATKVVKYDKKACLNQPDYWIRSGCCSSSYDCL
jgi:hypothetical protein